MVDVLVKIDQTREEICFLVEFRFRGPYQFEEDTCSRGLKVYEPQGGGKSSHFHLVIF